MSSKFQGLLNQARQRPDNDEQPQNDAPAPKIKTVSAQKALTKKPAAPRKSAAVPKVAEPTTPETTETTTPKRGRPRGGKRSDPNFTQITAYISKKTHQQVKLALLQEGENRELSELIEEELAKWLRRQ